MIATTPVFALAGGISMRIPIHHLLPGVGLVAIGMLVTWRAREHAPKMP